MTTEAWLGVAIGAATVFLTLLQLMLNRGRETRTDDRIYVERLTRCETRLDMIAPWVSAQMLHSPHNPYGIDPLLEMFWSESFADAGQIRELAQRLLWIQHGDLRAFRDDAPERAHGIPDRHRRLATEVLSELSRRYSLEPTAPPTPPRVRVLPGAVPSG